jgi:hypothetical protein
VKQAMVAYTKKPKKDDKRKSAQAGHKEKDMKKSTPPFTSYSRRPKARQAYFARVEKYTGLPMQGIVDSLAAQGLKLRTCIDLPDAPSPLQEAFPVHLIVRCESVAALLSFSPPS